MATNKQYNTAKYEQEHQSFAEACRAIRSKYRTSKKLTKKDLTDFPRGKVGDIISMNPEIPNDPKAAFELFSNYYASIQFELQKFLFIDKYKVWNKPSIVAEIKEIEAWVEQATKQDYANAVKSINSHVPEYQHLLLANGYYEGYVMTWSELQENSVAAAVYGRYFLFYEYLKNKMFTMEKPESDSLENIPIDFEDLPKYIVEQGILQRFGELKDSAFAVADYYNKWKYNFGNWLTTIPQKYLLKTVQKGIEFAKKASDYYGNSDLQRERDLNKESWERRIAIAEDIMNEILSNNKSDRKDFSKWIGYHPDWKEVAWRYSKGKDYRNKQDLIAAFWNGYVYYEQKFETYFEEFKVIPEDFFDKLIVEFRQSFPKHDRVDGVNYYDDLIQQLIERYKKILKSDFEAVTFHAEDEQKNKDFTTARQVLAIHYLFDYCNVANVDNTAKARFTQFLTGKETGAKTIKNTTIYKKFRNPFSSDNRTLMDDLKFIRVYFEELGLNEIAHA
ncbi:MAG: hypothetical protein EOP56_18820, partial [Sphingobacteriales bacterium]